MGLGEIFPKKERVDEKAKVSSVEVIRLLEQKCRLFQQVLFSAAREPIYQYSIGFDSEEEEEEDTRPPRIAKRG